MRFWLEALLAFVVSGVGVSVSVVGEADDAPGLVGIGCLLAASAVALGIRAGWRGGTSRATRYLA